MARTIAVFHERERMQEAVRELRDHGVVRDHILVVPSSEPDPRTRPRSFLGLPHRVHYAGIGAALGMLAGTALGGSGDTPTTVWFVITGAMFGALLGGIAGMMIGGARAMKWREHAPPREFTVRVETPSIEQAEDAAKMLASHGGEVHGPG